MTNSRPRRAQPGALAEEIGLLRDLLRQMQERVDDEQPLKELLSLADSLGRTTTRCGPAQGRARPGRAVARPQKMMGRRWQGWMDGDGVVGRAGLPCGGSAAGRDRRGAGSVKH